VLQALGKQKAHLVQNLSIDGSEIQRNWQAERQRRRPRRSRAWATLKKLCAPVPALRLLANLYAYKCEFARIRNRPRNLGRDLEVRLSTLPGSLPNIPSDEYGRCLGI